MHVMIAMLLAFPSAEFAGLATGLYLCDEQSEVELGLAREDTTGKVADVCAV